MTTLREVATLAQVSVATVSRVLRGDKSFLVPETTKQKVIDAADSLGYEVRGRKRIEYNLKVLTVKNPEFEQESPYFDSIIRGIREECERMGLDRSLSVHWYENTMERLRFSNKDNVVAVNCPIDLAKWFQTEGINAVFVNTNPDPKNFSSVVVDFVAGTRLALDHLIALGHEKIGLLCGSRDKVDPRLHEYRLYLSAKGLLRDNHILLSKDWTIDEGYHLGKMVAQTNDRPTAFFVASDRLAVGAIRAMAEHNISVPEDVAIVSFDDIDLAAYVTPQLTSVHVPSEAMGRLAARLVVEQFGREITPIEINVPLNLQIRESCGALIKNGK